MKRKKGSDEAVVEGSYQAAVDELGAFLEVSSLPVVVLQVYEYENHGHQVEKDIQAKHQILRARPFLLNHLKYKR